MVNLCRGLALGLMIGWVMMIVAVGIRVWESQPDGMKAMYSACVQISPSPHVLPSGTVAPDVHFQEFTAVRLAFFVGTIIMPSASFLFALAGWNGKELFIKSAILWANSAIMIAGLITRIALWLCCR